MKGLMIWETWIQHKER